MTDAEMDEYIATHPIDWPPLSQAKRIELAVLLRPDMPIGIMRTEPEPVMAPPEAT